MASNTQAISMALLNSLIHWLLILPNLSMTTIQAIRRHTDYAAPYLILSCLQSTSPVVKVTCHSFSIEAAQLWQKSTQICSYCCRSICEVLLYSFNFKLELGLGWIELGWMQRRDETLIFLENSGLSILNFVTIVVYIDWTSRLHSSRFSFHFADSEMSYYQTCPYLVRRCWPFDFVVACFTSDSSGLCLVTLNLH